MSVPSITSAEQGRNPSRFRIFLIVLTVLNVLAILVLLAGGWLSYGFAGSMNLGSDSTRPPYDRVTYSPLGYSYYVGDLVMSGPHRPLTWALLWLLIMLAAWSYQTWRYGTGPTGPRTRWGLRVTGLALLLSLLICLAVLPLAQSAQTAILGQNNQRTWIEATLTTLKVRVYDRCTDAQGCRETRSTFLNPFAAVLLLTTAAGVVALLPPRRLRS